MKSIITITLVSLFIVFNANAQEKGEKFREQMKAKKVAFITNKLELSVEEAQTFWPVYNEHDKNQVELQQKRREIMKKIHHNDGTLKDDELLAMIDKLTEIDLEQAQESKTYIGKVKKVLTASKIVKLFEAEREFKHSILKEYKGGMHGGPEGSGGPNCPYNED